MASNPFGGDLFGKMAQPKMPKVTGMQDSFSSGFYGVRPQPPFAAPGSGRPAMRAPAAPAAPVVAQPTPQAPATDFEAGFAQVASPGAVPVAQPAAQEPMLTNKWPTLQKQFLEELLNEYDAIRSMELAGRQDVKGPGVAERKRVLESVLGPANMITEKPAGRPMRNSITAVYNPTYEEKARTLQAKENVKGQVVDVTGLAPGSPERLAALRHNGQLVYREFLRLGPGLGGKPA